MPAVPPPPQVWGAVQVLHVTVPPQPSSIAALQTALAEHEIGWQHWPLMHGLPLAHEGQEIVPKHPSSRVPQLFAPQTCASVFGVHA